jgi:hypothetical protein
MRNLHHIPRQIEADDAAARQTLQQQACDLSGATAGIEYVLISAQVQSAKNTLSPPQLGR